MNAYAVDATRSYDVSVFRMNTDRRDVNPRPGVSPGLMWNLYRRPRTLGAVQRRVAKHRLRFPSTDLRSAASRSKIDELSPSFESRTCIGHRLGRRPDRTAPHTQCHYTVGSPRIHNWKAHPMRPSVRRFGPVLLWQLGTMLLWLGVLVIAVQLPLDGSLPEFFGAMVGVLLLAVLAVFVQALSLVRLTRVRPGRSTAISAEFSRLTDITLRTAPIMLTSSAAAAVHSGFLTGAWIFALAFTVVTACFWAAWAFGALRGRPEASESSDQPHGIEAGGPPA